MKNQLQVVKANCNPAGELFFGAAGGKHTTDMMA